MLLAKDSPPEDVNDNVAAMDEDIGDGGNGDVQLIFSDYPIKWDKPLVFTTSQNLVGMAKDALHIALKVEHGTNV